MSLVYPDFPEESGCKQKVGAIHIIINKLRVYELPQASAWGTCISPKNNRALALNIALLQQPAGRDRPVQIMPCSLSQR